MHVVFNITYVIPVGVSSALLIFLSRRISFPVKYMKILNLCLCWNLIDDIMTRNKVSFLRCRHLRKKNLWRHFNIWLADKVFNFKSQDENIYPWPCLVYDSA